MSDIYPFYPTYTGDIEWIKTAACKGMPTDWWHPRQGMSGLTKAELALAKSTCASCRHTQVCLQYGMETKSSGMYGGVLLRIGALPRKRGKSNANS